MRRVLEITTAYRGYSFFITIIIFFFFLLVDAEQNRHSLPASLPRAHRAFAQLVCSDARLIYGCFVVARTVVMLRAEVRRDFSKGKLLAGPAVLVCGKWSVEVRLIQH